MAEPKPRVGQYTFTLEAGDQQMLDDLARSRPSTKADTLRALVREEWRRVFGVPRE